MSAMSSPGAAGAWSYRTGPWFAAFGPRVSVLLPESQRDQVIGIWSLVDGGAGFDEVLDALLASGLSRLPGFVLVSTDDGPTRVLLRGTGVSASLTTPDEEIVLDGSAGATWVERSVEGVTVLSIVLADADAEDEHAASDLPIVTGLVRVAQVDRPPHSVSPEEAGSTEEVGALVGVAAVEAPPVEATPAEATPADEGDESLAGAVAFSPAVVGAPLDGPGSPEAAPDEVVAEEEETEPAMAEPAAPDDAMAEPATPEEEVVEPEVAEPEVAEQETVGPAWGEDSLIAAAAEEAAVLGEPSPFDEPAAMDAPVEEESGQATQAMRPIGGDPLSDPMPEEAPSDWVTPWGTPPPPPAEPPAEHAAEEPAWDQPSQEPAAPLDEPVTEVAPSYSPPPPPPADSPAPDLPPPPLTVGSWEPAGGFPPPAPDAAPAAPPAPAGPATSEAVAKLMISDGQQVLVDKVILIGRAPEARRFTSTEQPQLVTVPSRLHEISSTHVEVRPGTGADHGSAVVTDMGSTNGTVLVQPGLGPEDLKPGIAVALVPGSIINLGDGITIQVTRP
jgi:hypothetical protein